MVKLYNENNFISKHNKTKKSYKITKEHVIYIKKILNQRNNKFLSLEELNKKYLKNLVIII
tara:strand:+ start:474 stop:656 length:183 start_codon:yes stop_codon:yes gene_type:complete